MDLFGTLGPACARKDILIKLFQAGMTGIRLNLSHGSLTQAAPWLQLYQDAAKECGISHPKLLLDLQGPEIRVRKGCAPLRLKEGEILSLEKDFLAPEILLKFASPGDHLLLCDSAFELEVLPHGDVRVLRGGTLPPGKSLCISGKEIPAPALSTEDLHSLQGAKAAGVTGVMLSFVRGPEDLHLLRRTLEEVNLPQARVYAKLESTDGLERLPQMLELADVFLLARGDLGNRVPLWHLPRIQKRIAAALREANRPFAVATQLLSSMERSPVPTRAEVSDVFNAVLDGASVLLLTGETAAGAYPVEAMEVLSRTARDAADFVSFSL